MRGASSVSVGYDLVGRVHAVYFDGDRLVYVTSAEPNYRWELGVEPLRVVFPREPWGGVFLVGLPSIAIMRREGDASIDLLKLEIEGAEYKVLETIVEDRPDIKAILVEFDEVWHVKGTRAHFFRIRDASRRLIRAGWRLAHSTPMFKRLFVREDEFARLSAGRPRAS